MLLQSLEKQSDHLQIDFELCLLLVDPLLQPLLVQAVLVCSLPIGGVVACRDSSNADQKSQFAIAIAITWFEAHEI